MARSEELTPEVFEGGVSRYMSYMFEVMAQGTKDSVEDGVDQMLRQDQAAKDVEDYLESQQITADECFEIVGQALKRINDWDLQMERGSDD